MQINTYNLLKESFGISEKVLELIDRSEHLVSEHFSELDDIMAYNQYKVLDAFQKNGIRDTEHFSWNTGYGYDDPGRNAIEKVYADIFHTEASTTCKTYNRKWNTCSDADSYGYAQTEEMNLYTVQVLRMTLLRKSSEYVEKARALSKITV